MWASRGSWSGRTLSSKCSRRGAGAPRRINDGWKLFGIDAARVFSSLIKVLIVGAGRWGHIPSRVVERNLPLVTVVGVVGRDWQSQLVIRKPDAVIVASPSATHADIVVKLLDLKIPTMVEKPLATTLQDANRIAEAWCKSGEPPFLVDHTQLFSPAYARFREIVSKNPRTYFGLSMWTDTIQISDRMAVWEFGPHPISVIADCFSPRNIGCSVATNGSGYRIICDDMAFYAVMLGFSEYKRRIFNACTEECTYTLDDLAPLGMRLMALSHTTSFATTLYTPATPPLAVAIGTFLDAVCGGPSKDDRRMGISLPLRVVTVLSMLDQLSRQVAC